MKSGRDEAARGSIPGSSPRPDREHRKKPQPTTCYTVVCVKTAVEISEESQFNGSGHLFRCEPKLAAPTDSCYRYRMGTWKRILDRIAVAAKKLTSRAIHPRHWPNLRRPNQSRPMRRIMPSNSRSPGMISLSHSSRTPARAWDSRPSDRRVRLRFRPAACRLPPKERTGGGISPGCAST